MSTFTAGTPDSLASSVDCWSTRNDPLTSGSRHRPVSASLLYPYSDTTTPLSHEAPIKFDLLRYFGGGGPSHRLRTNLSLIACYLWNCVVSIAFSQSHGRESPPPPSARYLYRSSCNLPCISSTPLPLLSPYHTIIPYYYDTSGFLAIPACSCSDDQVAEWLRTSTPPIPRSFGQLLLGTII